MCPHNHFTTRPRRVLQMCEESSPPSLCTHVIHTYDKSPSSLPCTFVEYVLIILTVFVSFKTAWDFVFKPCLLNFSFFPSQTQIFFREVIEIHFHLGNFFFFFFCGCENTTDTARLYQPISADQVTQRSMWSNKVCQRIVLRIPVTVQRTTSQPSVYLHWRERHLQD